MRQSGEFPMVVRHQAFALNELGRDLVVGDIHGEFSVLGKALASVDFDEQRDRLFALGDLVDRGPESMAAVHWLQKPWFHAIVGNHELHHIVRSLANSAYQNFLEFCLLGEDDWVQDTDAGEYQQLVDRLAALPLAITLTSRSGRVGLVHAELPLGFQRWSDFVDAIATQQLGRREFWQALWSRQVFAQASLFGDARVAAVADLAAVFHGHSITDDFVPLVAGNRYYLETGLCARRICGRGGLTLTDIEHPAAPLLTGFWDQAPAASL